MGSPGVDGVDIMLMTACTLEIKPHCIVDRRKRDRVGYDGELEVGIADQVVDHPTAALSTPVLHPAFLTGDEENW